MPDVDNETELQRIRDRISENRQNALDCYHQLNGSEVARFANL